MLYDNDELKLELKSPIVHFPIATRLFYLPMSLCLWEGDGMLVKEGV